jgi:hypothetical protein
MYITSDRYWPILAALAIIPDGSFGATAEVPVCELNGSYRESRPSESNWKRL